MIEVRNHSAAIPPGIRDPYGVLGANAQQALNADAKAEVAQANVKRLAQAKANADRELKQAVERNDGKANLNALSRNVHRLARELFEAEEELTKATCVADAWGAERQRVRLDALAKELPELRAKFADAYRAAALLLGRYYELGREARELSQGPERLGPGTIARPPHPALTEADKNPDPLPALKNAGYRSVVASPDWRSQLFLEPLTKEEV